MAIHAHAAPAAGKALAHLSYEPGKLGPFDVAIKITHCGICHSDIHLIDNDWNISRYPLVPGHEIIGSVAAAGEMVSTPGVGQRVGVGWQSGSCMSCEWCLAGEENLCARQVATCVGRHGGFADIIQTDSRFTFEIPEAFDSETAAPLLCAGITVYSPLRRLGAKPSSRVGVLGIGGLGHLAVRFASAFGCEVTAFSSSPGKREEAEALGAHHFIDTSDRGAMSRAAAGQDLILATASAGVDWAGLLNALRPKGTLCILGAAPEAVNIPPMALLLQHKRICGSTIGNRSTIREMLQFAARKGISARTEVLPMAEVNKALERVRAGEARYRIVLAAAL